MHQWCTRKSRGLVEYFQERNFSFIPQSWLRNLTPHGKAMIVASSSYANMYRASTWQCVHMLYICTSSTAHYSVRNTDGNMISLMYSPTEHKDDQLDRRNATSFSYESRTTKWCNGTIIQEKYFADDEVSFRYLPSSIFVYQPPWAHQSCTKFRRIELHEILTDRFCPVLHCICGMQGLEGWYSLHSHRYY